MYCKTLAKTKFYVRFLVILLSLNLVFSVATKAQTTFVFTKLIKTTQDEPSRRFGSEATYQPSIRYMPTANNIPSQRFGKQQVGEASLEVVRRKIVKVAPGPEELVAKADKLLDSNQIEKAIELYRNVMSSNPKTTSAQFGLANALIEKGDYENALTELTKALDSAPNNSEGQINLGVIFYRNGNIDKSIDHYEKILSTIKEKEDLASANYNLAVAYAHDGNFKKAVTHYLTAVEQRKNYPQAYNNLGLIYEVLAVIAADEKESKQNLELAKQNFIIAIDLRKDDYALAHYNLARLYVNESVPEEQIKKKRTIEEQYEERQRLEELKYQRVINEFLVAIKQKADFAEAYLDLGNTYLLKTVITTRDDLPQAVKAFEKALEIRNNNYPLAHENLAIALSMQGKPEQAYPHYHKAINQYTEPSLQTLHNIISTVARKRNFLIGNELSRSEDVSNLRRQRDPQKLLEYLLEELEKYEELDDELKNVADLRYCAGHAYASVGDWNAAMEEFNKAWELSNKTDNDALSGIKQILELVKYY